MKQIIITLLTSFCVVTAWQLKAQEVAPNYYYADPLRFKHRIETIKDYTYVHKFEYDENHLLIKIASYQPSGSLAIEHRYSHNSAGYLILHEEWVGATLLQKDEYIRDEKGYITHYSRYMLDEESQPLVEDLRIEFFYNAEMKLIRAEIDAFNPQTHDWEDLRTTKLTYTESGLLHEVIQLTPDGEAEFNREVFSYNAQNKVIALDFIPGMASVGQEAFQLTYEYDTDGDIVKAGREPFWFYYKYDKEKLAVETFTPRPTIADLVYLGPKNYVWFFATPLDNGSKHAVLTEGDEDITAWYQSVPTSIDPTLPSAHMRLYPLPATDYVIVEIPSDWIGRTATITDLKGQVQLTHEVQSTRERIDIRRLQAGTYLLQIGDTTKKLVVW